MKMFAADGGVEPHLQPHLVDLNGPQSGDQTLAKTATREDSQGRLVTCRLDELHPHPSYVRHHFAVSITKLSALAEQGDLAFREPLTITRDRTGRSLLASPYSSPLRRLEQFLPDSPGIGSRTRAPGKGAIKPTARRSQQGFVKFDGS